MMEVPFIKLGPGQSARLAWQVIGQDGPIFVPKNIRYIAPGTKGLPNANMDSISGIGPLAALSGVNLALNVGVLAISAEILRTVNEVNNKLDIALNHLHSIQNMVDDIARRTKRIDIKVAESHLREALDYVMRNAIQADSIDLQRLVNLADDIESLIDVAETGIYSYGIRLSSDVRSRLSALHCFLFNLRKFVVEQHNLTCSYTPNRVIYFDTNSDYLIGIDRHIDFAKATVRFLSKVANCADSIASDVFSRFTFASDNDSDHYARTVFDGILDPFIEIFGEDFQGGLDLYFSLPDDISDSDDYEKIDNTITKMANSWLWGSDNGLLFMVHKELVGIRDGYQEWFYPQLAKSPELFSGIKQLTSEFDTSQLVLIK